MDPEETLDASPSEATPLEETEADAAIDETGTDAPDTDAPAETTPAAENELYELPDGRKVDAATLSQEWKENFMPEFTRRSQDLAAFRQGQQRSPEPAEADPLNDPDYIPPTYGTLAEQIEQRILGGMQARQQAEQDARQSLEDGAVAQLTEVKQSDPTVNEGRLLQHAMKYQFTDLRLAHASMRDTDAAVKAAMTHTKDNGTARIDPVSNRPGAAGTTLNPDAFASSVDYLRALKAQGKQ